MTVFLEKAQDAQFKKLKREREERRRQAEKDTENLENTRAEVLSLFFVYFLDTHNRKEDRRIIS